MGLLTANSYFAGLLALTFTSSFARIHAVENGAIGPSYSSMRALDKFGNSVQLKHAREAATRHGRTVVAAQLNDEIVVISVGNTKIVHSVTLPLPTSEGSTTTVAVCCTGMKSDADWLVKHLREYSAKVWERYDQQSLGIQAMAHFLSRLLGSYLGDDLEEEWRSLVYQGRNNKNNQLETSLSRPLGVQTLLLSTEPADNQPGILLVEPTGRVFRADEGRNFAFIVMGKQTELLRERLMKLYIDEPSTFKSILVAEVMKTLQTLNGDDEIKLAVETIAPGSTPTFPILDSRRSAERYKLS